MRYKVCRICKKEKEKTEFYQNKLGKDGKRSDCKDCFRKHVKKDRSARKSLYRERAKNRYRFSIETLKKHKYYGIKSRCEKPLKHKYSVYGSKYLTYKDYERWWELNLSSFNSLYEKWKQSGFIKKLAPSIDRVNNTKGYTPSNMRWITLSENSKKYNK